MCNQGAAHRRVGCSPPKPIYFAKLSTHERHLGSVHDWRREITKRRISLAMDSRDREKMPVRVTLRFPDVHCGHVFSKSRATHVFRPLCYFSPKISIYIFLQSYSLSVCSLFLLSQWQWKSLIPPRIGTKQKPRSRTRWNEQFTWFQFARYAWAWTMQENSL